MRPILFFAAVVLMLSSCSTPKNTAQFYQTYKNEPGVTNFKLPGWLVWLGGGLVYNSIQEDGSRAALRIARKVGKMRLLASENATVIPPQEINAFLGHIKQNGFDDLLSVRSGGSTVNFMVNDRRGKIRNLLILVNDEDGFVFLDLKTRIKYQEITELINYFIQKSKEEDEKEKEEAEEDTPRA